MRLRDLLPCNINLYCQNALILDTSVVLPSQFNGLDQVSVSAKERNQFLKAVVVFACSNREVFNLVFAKGKTVLTFEPVVL